MLRTAERGKAFRAFPRYQGIQAGVYDSRLLANPRELLRLLEKLVVDDQCRSLVPPAARRRSRPDRRLPVRRSAPLRGCFDRPSLRAQDEVDVAVEDLQKRHHLIDRFAIVRLVYQPIELSRRRAQAADDLTSR